MQAELVDRIYECSFVPELWPGVLDDLAALMQGKGGVLFAMRDKVLKWESSPALTDVFQAYVNDGWFATCDRRICMFSRNEPRFLVEQDFWSTDELATKPIYRDFFRPHGLGWSAGTGLSMPTGDNMVFTLERAYELGPVQRPEIDQLDALRPHLARAALISARMGMQNAKGGAGTLAVLGLPALILDENGMVLEANALMNDLAEHVTWRAHNRITLADVQANTQLAATLAGLDQTGNAPIQSFALRGKDGTAALVAHTVPMRRSAHDIFGSSYALLILTPVTYRRSPPVELLRSLFDLTPSEARVARGLATGDTLDGIAASGNVSRNTVRSQLQQVLEKMGCSRQAEVAALLSNVALGSVATAAVAAH